MQINRTPVVVWEAAAEVTLLFSDQAHSCARRALVEVAAGERLVPAARVAPAVVAPESVERPAAGAMRVISVIPALRLPAASAVRVHPGQTVRLARKTLVVPAGMSQVVPAAVVQGESMPAERGVLETAAAAVVAQVGSAVVAQNRVEGLRDPAVGAVAVVRVS